MREWLFGLGVAVGVMVASWLVLIVLARRLPEGTAKELARFLPVIGPLDDVVVVALAFRYAARQVPRDVLLEAWPGDRRIIERLIGPARPTAVG